MLNKWNVKQLLFNDLRITGKTKKYVFEYIIN